MARADLMKYIRTDKNGTKIFHDWTCPRCGGAGQADKWLFTGKVCYECGGTGKRARPRVVKEYTEEYSAKLEAKRLERAAKYAEDHAEEIAQKKAEEERRKAAWIRRENEWACKNVGCGVDGVGYILTGKTYPVKDQIKAAGGKWIFNFWVCPVEIKADGVNAKRVELTPNEYGMICDAADTIWEASK